MTEKEKIRAEIERLLNKEWKWGSSIEAKFRCEAYRELLEYIDSLSDEPVSEDLEEVAYRYAIKCEPLRDSYGGTTSPNPEIESAVIYGANWQKQQMMKDAIEGVVICDEKLTEQEKEPVLSDEEVEELRRKIVEENERCKKWCIQYRTPRNY